MNEPVKLLCAHPLNESEKARLQMRMDDLMRFLGSPGDWGYGTELGDLTLSLLRIRGMINRT